jgi:hypothetical protein
VIWVEPRVMVEIQYNELMQGRLRDAALRPLVTLPHLVDQTLSARQTTRPFEDSAEDSARRLNDDLSDQIPYLIWNLN